MSCANSDDGSATAQAIGGIAPFSYSWSNGNTGATIDDLVAGTYFVTATDANGCTGETDVTLEAPAGIFASTVIQDVTCFGDDDGAIIVESPTGGAAPYMFSINGSDFTQAGLFGNLSAGNYDLIVQDANGCEETFSQSIIEPAELQVSLNTIGDDEELQLGDSIQIRAQINTDTSFLQSWDWTRGLFWLDEGCDSCDVRWIYPMESTLYEYLVVDDNGCIGRDESLITVRKDRPVYIPNAFSPNGDGNNDFFQIYLGAGVKKVNHFKVYNRWGEVVYELNDFFLMAPEEGWDGRFRGDIMNPAVFVYWAEVEFIDGHVEMYKGDVTLTR